MSFDSHRHPENYAADPAARAFSMDQLATIAQFEKEAEQEDVELIDLNIPTCEEGGHVPRRALADNGFTYETLCARCGKKMG